MRLCAMLAAICVLSESALADTPECKAILDDGTGLACHDKTIAPAAAAKYVDTIGAGDARMNATEEYLQRLLNRGCQGDNSELQTERWITPEHGRFAILDARP
jgi:hypothetical protein